MGSQEKIDINSASFEELKKTPWIGPSRARAIVEYRNKHGSFSDINELLCVEGISQYDFNFMKLFVNCSLSNPYYKDFNEMTSPRKPRTLADTKSGGTSEMAEKSKSAFGLQTGKNERINGWRVFGFTIIFLGLQSYL